MRVTGVGMRFVAVGSDLGVLRTQSKALADKFRDAAGPGLAAQY